MLIPSKFPQRIETPRLRLATWQANLFEATQLRHALDSSDAHLRPWIPFMRHEPRTLEETLEAMTRFEQDVAVGKAIRFAIWHKGSEALLGECMLISHVDEGCLEVGYWLHVDHQSKGFATEAVTVLCDMALDDENVHALCFRCDTQNEASSRLASRLGATLRDHQLVGEATLGVWWLGG